MADPVSEEISREKTGSDVSDSWRRRREDDLGMKNLRAERARLKRAVRARENDEQIVHEYHPRVEAFKSDDSHSYLALVTPDPPDDPLLLAQRAAAVAGSLSCVVIAPNGREGAVGLDVCLMGSLGPRHAVLEHPAFPSTAGMAKVRRDVPSSCYYLWRGDCRTSSAVGRLR